MHDHAHGARLEGRVQRDAHHVGGDRALRHRYGGADHVSDLVQREGRPLDMQHEVGCAAWLGLGLGLGLG